MNNTHMCRVLVLSVRDNYSLNLFPSTKLNSKPHGFSQFKTLSYYHSYW